MSHEFKPELTLSQLAALDHKGYVHQIKARLRDDERWLVLLDPVLVERTRASLARVIDSIDAQKTRVAEEGDVDQKWLHSINGLRRHAKARLDAIAPTVAPVISGSKEARAWRRFSARLAGVLESADHPALDELKAPYGGLTAREWLAAREEKEMAR